MNEEWRDIPGYEGLYQVSSDGQVKSLARVVIRKNGRPYTVGERVLRQCVRDVSTGYLSVGLHRAEQACKRVHVLVLLAFVGDPPTGMEGCHNDGNPSNNTLSNLRWDTPSSNRFDMVSHGRHYNAEKTFCNRGHPYSADNTYIHPNGYRVCRMCKPIWQARYLARKTVA